MTPTCPPKRAGRNGHGFAERSVARSKAQLARLFLATESATCPRPVSPAIERMPRAALRYDECLHGTEAAWNKALHHTCALIIQHDLRPVNADSEPLLVKPMPRYTSDQEPCRASRDQRIQGRDSYLVGVSAAALVHKLDESVAHGFARDCTGRCLARIV